jgi:glycosyltransferase involved in cell wall biosynthesis
MHKITVLLDTSPLRTGSQVRGIGMYTRLLKKALEERDDVLVTPVESKDELRKTKKVSSPENLKSTLIHYPFFDLFFDTLPLLRKLKTVVTIHDVIPLKFPQYYPPGKKGFLRFYKQKLALKSVEAIITDSQSSKDDIVEFLKIKSNKVHVVHLAASPAFTAQSEKAQEDVLKAKKLPRQYILYVGDINYNKNIPQLIKTLKFIPEEIDLVCVGRSFYPQDIPEWKWIETQIALSDVAKRVHFVTDIETDDVDTLAALYSGAIAYIQPSLYEGFGLPILEAMQTKTPVIASNNSSIIEVSGDHALLVEPIAEAFGEAVQKILSWSKVHRQEVVKAAYIWSQRFEWSKVAAQTVEVYKRVLNYHD